MNYLYITLNKSASVYAISLDEILMTLYGFGKRKKFKSYSPVERTRISEVHGVVYRIEVTPEQHDQVRDLLCDFLMDSRKQRARLSRQKENFSSSEFISHILYKAGISDVKNEIDDIARLDHVNVIYEGDLRSYVPETVSYRSYNRKELVNCIKKDKKVMKDSTHQYEYVPNQV